MNCRLCNRIASDGMHLSDGGMIHWSCLDSLQNEAKKAEAELLELQSKLSKLERDLKRRDGIGFKIISIFSKPDIESTDIKKSIPVILENITHSSSALSEIKARLASIYDYFMSYPPDWDERKSKVIIRDGDSCSGCGGRRHLHLHHMTPLSRGGNNTTSNLKLLCKNCHSNEHGGRDFTGKFSNTETAFSKRVSNIRCAIEQGKRVRFGYKKFGEKGYKKRTIQPIELVNIAHNRDSGSTLCILGFCELRQANRNFALKRMRGLKVV